MASRPAQVNAAAARLIEGILADEVLVAWIAEQEIARRITDGDLIPAEALRHVPGMELVPLGVLPELRECLHELSHHPAVSSIDGLEPLVERCRIAAIPYAEHLLTAPPVARHPAHPEPTIPADQPVEETTSDIERAESGAASEDRPPGMPDGMPNGPVYCDGCGNLLASPEKYPDDHPPSAVPCHDDCINQAQFSWTRFRVPLCKGCMGERSPKGRRRAA